MSSIAGLLSKSPIADMRVRTPRDLGAVIRNRRKQQQLDQKSLAERVGVSRQWIIAIEQGKPRADMTLVLRTLEALGLRLRIEEENVEDPATAASALGAVTVPDIDAIVAAARRPGPSAPPAARVAARPRAPARKPTPSKGRP